VRLPGKRWGEYKIHGLAPPLNVYWSARSIPDKVVHWSKMTIHNYRGGEPGKLKFPSASHLANAIVARQNRLWRRNSWYRLRRRNAVCPRQRRRHVKVLVRRTPLVQVSRDLAVITLLLQWRGKSDLGIPAPLHIAANRALICLALACHKTRVSPWSKFLEVGEVHPP